MKELKEDAGYFPILWFGNRKGYERSNMRIITVALNPSETEYYNDVDGDDKTYRFPNKEKKSLEESYNEYFIKHPYHWFNNFEYVLRGLGASYGGTELKIDDEKCGEAYQNRAIHTDLCTPYATRPSWTELSESDQQTIAEKGIPKWRELVEDLRPNIMIFSLARKWWGKTEVGLKVEKWRIISDFVKDGEEKEKLGYRGKMNYYKGIYNLQDGTKVLAILGITNRVPFGDLDKDEKKSLGKAILEEYNKMTNNNEL